MYGNSIAKIAAILLLALLVLPLLALGSLSFLVRIPNDLSFYFRYLLAPSTYSVISSHIIEILVSIPLAFTGMVLLSELELTLPYVHYHFSTKRNLPSLLVGYWIFVLLSFPIVLQFETQTLAATGLNPAQAKIILTPVAVIIMASTAFAIRVMIKRGWHFGSGSNLTRVGEFFLLIIFTDIFYRIVTGESNPISFFVSSSPIETQVNTIWQWSGTLLSCIPFALIDRFALRSPHIFQSTETK
jgi:hypothetical protein